ncbi:PREDICTED: hyaluronan mediated motility receptor-like isoform X4 [Vollenhovia emeryi]|uniref:hyaluronan mediated motility receptor-like isoform X4 n=1 Tax=Vollenhovia emeryi TaxID=411798 RepID=UPI0005F3B78F|nr:PREDICTED: hyaluronan mediated motility receptor-like isoform X4 [Vollenhovia emeryi]
MSFSKARLQRFNEFGSDAPPPGAYDPKFDSKVKGPVIEKSDRFVDNKSTSSADCSGSIVSVKSNASTPVFRVPQAPPKRTIKPGLTYPKLKTQTIQLAKGQSMKYENLQQLADLQVECSNKDKTIQEHEKHIEDMKDEMRKLEYELEELRKKQDEIEAQHMKDIEKLATLHQGVLNDHDENHQAEIQSLRYKLLEMTEEKEREISTRKAMEMELRNRAAELVKGITTLEAELCAKREEDGAKIEALETEIAELLNKLEKAKQDYDIEIGLLEKEKYQLDICVANLTQDRSDLESKLEIRQNEISELEAQLSALQCELHELKAQYEELASDYVNKFSDFTNKYEEQIEHMKNDFWTEKEKLVMENELYKARASKLETKANKMEETNCSLMEELKNLQRCHEDVTLRLQEAQNELELLNEKHTIMIEKYKKDLNDMTNMHRNKTLTLEKVLEDAADEYLKELGNVTKAKDKEIEDLKQAAIKKIEEETELIMKHARQMIEESEADKHAMLATYSTESEEQVKKTIVECDAKVHAMVEETRNTVEEEMRLANDRYKACLLRMEVERTALDKKLLQRDNEITKLSITLEELRSSVETQASFSQSLQLELDKAESDLAEKKEELRALKDQIRTEAAGMVARKKRELVDQHQSGNMSQFDKIKSLFETKIENLKQKAAKEISRLEDDAKLKSILNDELRLQLDEMSKNINEAQGALLVLEEQNDARQIDISRMELINNKLIEELKSRDKALDESKLLLQDQAMQHKIILDKANSQIKQLSEKVKQFEEMGPTAKETTLLLEQERNKWKSSENELMQQLKKEIAKRERAEEEIAKFAILNEDLKKNYVEITEQYAEAIGHQNPKQRIKHVIRLKDKKCELEQELLTKTRLVEQQQKTIEKLKAEEKRSHWKGKENVGMVHSTPISSPHKTTPLRDRND